MAKVITIYNHKGGSGKTLVGTNLAASFAYLGHKTLIIDNDSQCNCSSRVGYHRHPENVERVYNRTGSLPILAVENCPGLYIAPGSRNLNRIDREMFCSGLQNQFLLKEALEGVKEHFKYVVIDTPPDSLSMLVYNSLMASDAVIIPVDSDGPSSLENLDTVFESINEVVNLHNNKLEILGIVQNRDDGDSSARTLEEQLLEVMKSRKAKELIFKTRIRNFKQYKRAAWFDLPIPFHAPGSDASDNFLTFTKEVMKRLRK